MSADLIVFLNTRLDEDEARAKGMDHFVNPEDEFYSCPAARNPLGDLERGENATCDCLLAERKERALREIEAKRAILAGCVETLQGEDSHDYLTEGGSGEEYILARFVVRQLAAIYSDHPDYREAAELDRASSSKETA